MCCNEKVTQMFISEDGREGTLVPWHKGKGISSSESEIHLLSIAEFRVYGRGFLVTSAFPGVKSRSKLCVEINLISSTDHSPFFFCFARELQQYLSSP